jgi:hypothetical protein
VVPSHSLIVPHKTVPSSHCPIIIRPIRPIVPSNNKQNSPGPKCGLRELYEISHAYVRRLRRARRTRSTRRRLKQFARRLLANYKQHSCTSLVQNQRYYLVPSQFVNRLLMNFTNVLCFKFHEDITFIFSRCRSVEEAFFYNFLIASTPLSHGFIHCIRRKISLPSRRFAKAFLSASSSVMITQSVASAASISF